MNFKSHSYEAWLTQVTKELSPKLNLEDVVLNDKFFTHSGLPFPKEVQSGKGQLNSDVLTGLANLTSLGKEDIENVLNLGIEAVYFTFTDDYFPDLSYIDFQYIHAVFDVSNLSENRLLQFYKNLNEKYVAGIQETFVIINDKASKKEHWYKLSFNSENIIAQCKKMVELIEKGSEKIFLEFHTDINLNTNISILRAMRSVMENLKLALKKTNLKYKIAVVPNIDIIQPVTDEAIIRLNYLAIASNLGSADYLHLIPFSQDFEKARIALNMLNVFRHEAFLDNYRDAVSGSYFYEDITEQTALKIWQSLQ